MERAHAALFEATGVAIVVVTVRALEDETISDFALRVAEEWGVGRKGEDRGIVIALATEERQIYVATGYGVEGYLPDGKVGRLIDRYSMPYLRTSDFSTALYQLSTALVAASAEEFKVSIDAVPALQEPPQESPRSFGLLQILGAILVAIFFLYMAIRHPRLLLLLLFARALGRSGGGGFGGGSGFGGFGGGGFGGGGAGRGF